LFPCCKFQPYLYTLMKKEFHSVKERIITLIDFFYPFFGRLMDLQSFRYAAAGGGNTIFDIILYFVTYNFILHKEILYAGPIAVSPHIAAFMITLPITFLSGFLLMRYVVFPESTGTRKRVQISRYLAVVFICILLNYGFLKLFVDVFGWWPLPSKILTTIFVVTFSYLSQKHFTFRKQPA
jgi:putative flippase GtrA